MLDAASGLDSVQSKGILHRDVKPDNVFVFSLDGVVGVNGKLMDFGSSRNVNVQMTNMTFTKGIGSPVYMAPEVVNKSKNAADVFSLAMTMMFKCFKCCEPNWKARFKYPWPIKSLSWPGSPLIESGVMFSECVTQCMQLNSSYRCSVHLCFKSIILVFSVENDAFDTRPSTQDLSVFYYSNKFGVTHATLQVFTGLSEIYGFVGGL